MVGEMGWMDGGEIDTTIAGCVDGIETKVIMGR